MGGDLDDATFVCLLMLSGAILLVVAAASADRRRIDALERAHWLSLLGAPSEVVEEMKRA